MSTYQVVVSYFFYQLSAIIIKNNHWVDNNRCLWTREVQSEQKAKKKGPTPKGEEHFAESFP